MKLTAAKKDSQIVLPGVNVSVERHDDTINSVTFAVGDALLKVMVRDTYSRALDVLIPAPPEMVKKHKLSGKFAGLIDVEEYFDSDYDAQQRLREYEQKHAGPDEELGLTITEVEVPEE